MIELLDAMEDKVLRLVTELETTRKEIHLLKLENETLKAAQGTHMKKLNGLVSLLNVLDPAHVQMSHEMTA